MNTVYMYAVLNVLVPIHQYITIFDISAWLEFVSILYHCLNVSRYGDILMYCPISNRHIVIHQSSDTLSIQIHSHIDISNIIYQRIDIKYTVFNDWYCIIWLPALWLYNYLVLLKRYIFGKKILFFCKHQLIHTVLYRPIYCSIMIQKR